ncbi:MAG TPA: maleylpyruvate isomerase family mycothiol-dependent enzyme [Candidatus Saccharimonadales bacterium]|nr:maleylpyruvate isomerase family mycothiol-dependent enzyme [Candidatus Saccharimonadales bacterium]
MSVQVQPSRINVMDHAGKDHLLSAVRQARTEFFDLVDNLDAEGWATPTACTEWQVRDVAAHMVDVTEAYLQRWALARSGQSVGSAVGVQDVMPHGLDAAAKKLREVPQQELIARLKRASDELFVIFDGIDSDKWGGELVEHVYMGPLPAFIYMGFQLIDYAVHSWDIRAGLGRSAPIPDAEADALIPYMFFVLHPSTVDQKEAEGLDATWGVRVSGEAGGSWRATLKNGQLSYEEGSVAGMPVVFNFDPNDFVLTSFQRISGGAAIGDQALAARIRRLWFKI